jgi:hypothetical protein
MIEEFPFGSMKIAGQVYQGDLKIIEGQVVAHWWRRQGHVLDVADVDDILAAHPAFLVVGTGHSGRMRVTEALRQAAQTARIELIAESTAPAVTTVNRLHAAGKRVAGAFHLTC